MAVIVFLMAGTQLPTPVIGNKAHQPCTLQFPQCELGKTSMVSLCQIAGHGCPMMKIKISPSDFHMSLLTKTTSSTQLIARRKLLFQ